jgi:hypothetical protein
MAAKTLADYRQEAQDLIDDSTLRTAGRLSSAWWTRRINKVKDVVAQSTGFYITNHIVPVTKYNESAAMPSALCWGVFGVRCGKNPLEPVEEPFESELWLSGFASQPGSAAIKVVSSSAADTTQTITIYGTTAVTGVVTAETLTLNGVSTATTIKTTWDRLLYAELSAVCAGTVTISYASTTITTIAIGSTTAGWKPSIAAPYNYRIQGQNIYFTPVPSENTVVYITGGSVPADLSGETDTISGLPLQFQWLISVGAAAEAQGINLYDDTGSARTNSYFQQFIGGVQELNKYLNNIDVSRNGSISLARR